MRILILHCLLAISLLVMTGCSPSDNATVNPVADTAPQGKLPGGVRPQAYRLELLLDPRRDDFSGNVEIDIQLDSPAKQIWLHGENLQVDLASGLLP